MVTTNSSPAPLKEPPAPRRQRLAPTERASQILDVAAQLLLAEGFSEMSMERLGREAGVSKGLVYNYFPTPTDLLRSLLEREIAALQERQIEAVKGAKNFRELIRATTRLYIEHIQERGPLLRRLLSENSVARTLTEQDVQGRDKALRYVAKQVANEYGLPLEVALSAVDMQMAMTEAAAQRLAKSQESVDFATDICVTLLFGGLESLAASHKARTEENKETALPVSVKKPMKVAKSKLKAGKTSLS